MHRVRMLIHFGATPVIVFDGAALPMKADKHAERRERRTVALTKAEKALAGGNARLAEEWYQKACPVTPEMARKLIRQLRKMNVEYVVAPYEADAQLAWMMQTGHVESVITEDSDLLVYGASRVLYKMTKTGEGDLYEMKNLPSLDAISMLNFTEDMFVYMCVCSGCDFFKGVTGLGIRKSHTLVRKYRTMSRLCQVIRHDRRYKVTKTFTMDFARACLVFRHQTVYDVVKSETVHLRALDDVAKAKLPSTVLAELEEGLDLSFLGAHRDPAIAKGVAEGLLHPSTLHKYNEPLDIIERPVLKRRRPLSFPEPEEQSRSTQRRNGRAVRGFQVQPAGSGAKMSVPSAPNLRQRLGGRSRSFNPRRVAARFRAQNTFANTANPTFALTSNVWAKFRRKPINKQEDGNDAQQPVSSLEDEADTAKEGGLSSDSEEANKDDVNDVMVASRLVKRPRPSDSDSRCEKRMKLCPPAPHRVAALNRAVNRFASQPSPDGMFKFKKSVPQLTAPPSPDRDAYDLFDEIDAELSRDAEETNIVPLAENKATELLPKPNSTNQIRLSRFFAKKNETKIGSGSTNHKTGPKLIVSPDKACPPRSHKLVRSNTINSMNRFKRGATGKRIITKPHKP